VNPALLEPSRTAVLTMEMQRGVVGDLSALESLATEVAAAGTIGSTARLVVAAREAGVRVVHCTAEFRPDLAGTALNCPLMAVMARRPGHLVVGSPSTQIVPELGPEEADVIVPRRHGISPFTGTSLDATLRNLGVGTVVATGVSLNLAILGLCIEAVGLGYQVVLATDAVAGVPRDYGQAVIDNSLALVATRATVDDIVGAWQSAGGGNGVPAASEEDGDGAPSGATKPPGDGAGVRTAGGGDGAPAARRRAGMGPRPGRRSRQQR
jgi:biuret amidohydrolase